MYIINSLFKNLLCHVFLRQINVYCRVRIMTIHYVDSMIFIDTQDDQQVHKFLSHGRILHGCSRKYSPRCWKCEKGYFGHSSRVPNTKIVSLSPERLGTIDYTAPVSLFVTGIFDLDTHSNLLLIEVIVLAFFCDWKLQQVERSTWEIMFTIN